MVTLVIIGLFGVLWGVAGLLTATAPALMLAWTRRLLIDGVRRFWAAQAVLLAGVLLIVGTSSLDGFRLWVACGVLSVAKGCLVLGASGAFWERVLRWIDRWPVWLLRCDGVLAFLLAALLGADVLRHIN